MTTSRFIITLGSVAAWTFTSEKGIYTEWCIGSWLVFGERQDVSH
ncbi:Uncharacterised protein [Salmonella enterica subsp. enterica]|uniref:Uncharacterized protein n=1 Tax=Salmonella enterica I TaxID=59201 RepID=A0A379VLL8_SALET|nr:Uncharacterised protein [Salmonella enterica subsp. enterica]